MTFSKMSNLPSSVNSARSVFMTDSQILRIYTGASGRYDPTTKVTVV